MNDNRQRMSARDYKHAGRSQAGFDFTQYRQLGIGLAAGLAVALAVWLYDHRGRSAAADAPTATEAAAHGDNTAPKQSAAAETADDPARDYAFYDMLPKFEMTAPEKGHGAHRNLPDEPVTQPGVYVLQVAFYRSRPDADRMSAKLAKLGIEATVQHVTVDADEGNRVRIGPINDLAKLNAIRKTLRTADIDAIIYRVGD